MPTNEEKYAEYLKDLSTLRVTMLSLLSGFSFTTITLLLNQLGDPHSFISQLTLFFLTVVFDLFVFLLAWQTVIVVGVYDVPYAPPPARWELTVFNLTMFLAFNMWGLSLALIFFLWNLTYLALASGMAWALVLTATMAATRSMGRRLGWSIREGLKDPKKWSRD